MAEHDLQQLVANGSALGALFKRCVPRTFDEDADLNSFPMLAVGLMARAQHALDSAILLQHRPVDAAVLARVTFEHVVTVAWLAISDDNVKRFAHGEAANGRELTSKALKYFESKELEASSDDLFSDIESAAGEKGMGKLPQWVEAAEAHWKPLLPVPPRFQEAYDTDYRLFSLRVHPRAIGVTPFWMVHDGRLQLRSAPVVAHASDGVVAASYAFAIGLLVTGAKLGWPEQAETRATLLRGLKVPETFWRFSDGTVIVLGGEVAGTSKFALGLRRELREGAHVTIWPQPAPVLDVDPNDVAMMNAWLDHQVDVAQRCDGLSIEVTARPANIPPLPPAPYKNSDDPNVIYSPPEGRSPNDADGR